jgi:hypothetical protein
MSARWGDKMAGEGGTLKAQEIMRELTLDDARLSRRQIEDNIITSDSPLFFESLKSLTGDNLESLNSEMRLVGDHAFTFTPAGCEFSFGRKLMPIFMRKVMFRQASKEVIVRTTIIRGYTPQEVKEKTWRFTVAHSDLALDGKNVLECANALMDGIEMAFR